MYKNLRFRFDNPIVLLSSLVLKNFKIAGLSKTTVKSVKSDFGQNSMNAEIEISIPQVVVEGLYKGEGRYTNIRVAPKGYFNLTAGNHHNYNNYYNNLSPIVHVNCFYSHNNTW